MFPLLGDLKENDYMISGIDAYVCASEYSHELILIVSVDFDYVCHSAVPSD